MDKMKDIDFTKEDFQLCQASDYIKDKDLDAKQVSFFKDALKRFRKNKSSVVAACIIGTMLLLTAVVPVLSPYSVDLTLNHQTKLPEKIFNAGTGFLDGTKSYTGQIYDYKNDNINGFNMDYIVKKTFKITETVTTNATKGAYGGTLIVPNTGSRNFVSISNYHALDLDFSQNIKMNIDIDEEAYDSFGSLAEFRVVIISGDNEIELLPKGKRTGVINLDVSKIAAEAGFVSIPEAKFYFEVYNTTSKTPTYLPINSFEFTSDAQETSDSADEVLLATNFKNISMLDANEKLLQSGQQTGGTFLPGYWQARNTNLKLEGAELHLASFSYDEYSHIYGDTIRTINTYEFESYIENGWISFDDTIGVTSFKVLSDKSPIKELISIEENASTGNKSYTANVTMYKYYGYDFMPRYILGTDSSGHDLFTKVFSGLSLSLGLALAVSAICITFGIVWGAISGYYGGQVDIAMERFMDILARIPTMLLIPLLLTLIGQNLFSMGVVFCLTSWMGAASVTRTQFYRFKGREYVLASRTLGARDGRLIFKHILPNAAGTIITSAVMLIPGIISLETSIAYYGLGLSSSNTLGVIMSDNQGAISDQPLLILFPAALFSLLLISFNLFGNGLRDAFNTSLRGSE